MLTLDRKKLVQDLVLSSRKNPAEEARRINEQIPLTEDFVYEHLRKYIMSKFLLSEDTKEDNIEELSALSLAKTINLDKSLMREFDQAAPCDNATSESTKKILLFYAIQRDLELPEAPAEIIQVKTIRDLAGYVCRKHKNNQ